MHDMLATEETFTVTSLAKERMHVELLTGRMH